MYRERERERENAHRLLEGNGKCREGRQGKEAALLRGGGGVEMAAKEERDDIPAGGREREGGRERKRKTGEVKLPELNRVNFTETPWIPLKSHFNSDLFWSHSTFFFKIR